MLCCAITSRPIVGSSRNSTSGECSSAAISSIFIRSPSDSSRTGWLSKRRTSEQIDQLVVRAVETRRVDAVNLLVQAERLGGGQVPPELVLLPHHQGEAAAIGVLALPGDVAHHAGRAAGGIDHAGEQLERGGLAGAVGPEKGDELALLDRQVDAAHRLHLAVLAMEQARERGPEAFLLLVNAIRLLQVCDFDDRHGPQIIGSEPLGGTVEPLRWPAQAWPGRTRRAILASLIFGPLVRNLP